MKQAKIIQLNARGLKNPLRDARQKCFDALVEIDTLLELRTNHDHLFSDTDTASEETS